MIRWFSENFITQFCVFRWGRYLIFVISHIYLYNSFALFSVRFFLNWKIPFTILPFLYLSIHLHVQSSCTFFVWVGEPAFNLEHNKKICTLHSLLRESSKILDIFILIPHVAFSNKHNLLGKINSITCKTHGLITDNVLVVCRNKSTHSGCS